MTQGTQLLRTDVLTSTGMATTIDLGPVMPDMFQIYNITKFGSTTATADFIRAEWIRGLPAGSAYIGNKTATANAVTIQLTTMSATNGFTLNDTSMRNREAEKITGAITAASPPVVTLTAPNIAGLSTGDIVTLYDTTGGMEQIRGMDFSINIASATTLTFPYMNASSGFTAATAAKIRRVPFDAIYYPRRRLITSITAGTTTTVHTSVAHGYNVGDYVRLIVPRAFGMTQLNRRIGKITAVTQSTSTSSFTVDIDSSGFTAFAFPASTVADFTFAQVVPVGESGTSLNAATENISSFEMVLGSSVVGASGDELRWFAYKAMEG